MDINQALTGQLGGSLLLQTADPSFFLSQNTDSSHAGYIYIGYAVAGTLTSQALWSVKRIDISTPNVTKTQWAGGNNANESIWDNRTSLTYI